MNMGTYGSAANTIQAISDFIFVDDKAEEADIIFIPGGSYPELGEKAADIYRGGYATYVMPSGGVSIKTGRFNGVKSKKDVYHQNYRTEYEFLKDVLTINGVPEKAIIKEDRSAFTKDNAIKSREVLDRKGIKIRKAIICCKSFHARRSLLSYQLAFPEADFLICPYPYMENDIRITKDQWFMTEVGTQRVLGELARCGNQFNDEILGMLGLNNSDDPSR